MIKLSIGDKIIKRGGEPFIIAEAGVNHNGRLDLALKLIDAAVRAGADAIKFQAFRAEQVVTGAGKMADYQKNNLAKVESQLKMLSKLEFAESWYPNVINYCEKKGIVFLSTPHGSFESIDLLYKFGVPAYKFGSGDLTSTPLLDHAAKFKKPIILGTGMATMAEVKEAIRAIKRSGNSKIIVLHCTTNYPCPPEEVNLDAMRTMMRDLDVLVGYSDHTIGFHVAVMAVVLGACVIEKHLTLDNNLPGPDHKASANPVIFKAMVDEIRRVKTIMGSPAKRPSLGEIKLRPLARRSIVAVRDIKKGDILSLDNIGLKRPGTGIEPRYFFKLMGLKSKKDIKSDTLIKKGDFGRK